MKEAEEYLDKVCSYIKNVPYRRTVRRELKAHIEDCMEEQLKKGCDCEAAEKRAVEQMGDAVELGEQLNRQYVFLPNYKIVIYVLGMFCLNFFLSIGTDFSAGRCLLTVCLLGSGILLFQFLRAIDWEKFYFLIPLFYCGLLCLLLVTCLFAEWSVRKACVSAGGVGLLLGYAFWVYRLQEGETYGFLMAVFLLLVPIPLFLSVAAYAALLLYLVGGSCILIEFLRRDWMCGAWVKYVMPIFLMTILGLIVLNHFSVVEMKVTLWNSFSLNRKDFMTYPLAAYAHRYGIWVWGAYFLLFFLMMTELERMKRNVHHFLGRTIFSCMIGILSIKGVFSILLNVGYPFIRSYAVPFLGVAPDQISNLLMIVIAEYIYCFGDAVFGDYSFHAENKLAHF